jgi:hypothetical protein
MSYGAADGLSHQLTDLYCWIASDPFVWSNAHRIISNQVRTSRPIQ